MTTSTIWIVEDDAACSDIVVSTLAEHWTLRTFDSLGALERAAEDGVDAALLIADVCLPDKNLVAWLRSSAARAILAAMPLLVMSAIDEVEVIRSAFEGGAVDFISKPFRRADLTVKVERALGRPSASRVRLAHELDVAAMVVRSADGKSVPLTAKEMQIAAILWNAPGRSISRDALQASIWSDTRVGRKTLAVHLSRLRRKVREIGLDVRHGAGETLVLCTVPPATAPDT